MHPSNPPRADLLRAALAELDRAAAAPLTATDERAARRWASRVANAAAVAGAHAGALLAWAERRHPALRRQAGGQASEGGEGDGGTLASHVAAPERGPAGGEPGPEGAESRFQNAALVPGVVPGARVPSDLGPPSSTVAGAYLAGVPVEAGPSGVPGSLEPASGPTPSPGPRRDTGAPPGGEEWDLTPAGEVWKAQMCRWCGQAISSAWQRCTAGEGFCEVPG